MGLILFIIGLVIAIGGLGYLLYMTISLVRSPMLAIDFKKTLSKYGIFAGIFVLGLVILLIGIPLWLNWSLQWWEWLCTPTLLILMRDRNLPPRPLRPVHQCWDSG